MYLHLEVNLLKCLLLRLVNNIVLIFRNDYKQNIAVSIQGIIELTLPYLKSKINSDENVFRTVKTQSEVLVNIYQK